MRFSRRGSGGSTVGRVRRRAASALVVLIVAFAGLPWPPSAVGAPVGATGKEPRSSAAPDPPAAIPGDERLPVPAFPDENWIVDPPEVGVDIPEDVPPDQFADALDLLPGKGGPNLDVFAAPNNPGAGHVALLYGDDVNAQNADGKWKRINADLVPEATGGGWTVDLPDATLRFPGSLSSADPVRFILPGTGTLTMAPVGIGTVPGSADGFTVTYADALPSTDLTYSTGLHGFSEFVILKDPGAPASVSFDVDAPGFELRLEPTGEIAIVRGPTVVAIMPTPVAWDSSPQPVSASGSYQLQASGGNGYVVTMLVDPAFLAAATYPVTIDPGTTSIQGTGAPRP